VHTVWFYAKVITFHVRRSRGEMYVAHSCLCVCVSVCLSLATFPYYGLTGVANLVSWWPLPIYHTETDTRLTASFPRQPG